jgi:hypothetical protein
VSGTRRNAAFHTRTRDRLTLALTKSIVALTFKVGCVTEPIVHGVLRITATPTVAMAPTVNASVQPEHLLL